MRRRKGAEGYAEEPRRERMPGAGHGSEEAKWTEVILREIREIGLGIMKELRREGTEIREEMKKIKEQLGKIERKQSGGSQIKEDEQRERETEEAKKSRRGISRKEKAKEESEGSNEGGWAEEGWATDWWEEAAGEDEGEVKRRGMQARKR